jgi:acyl-coenzyme A synthetase/AMP-(fatty) acid ligase
VFAWAQSALGVTINEMFGQTEMNYIVGNSQRCGRRSRDRWASVSGPSDRVIDDDGSEVRARRAGESPSSHRARRHPDPVFFLEYFGNPEARASKFTGEWCRTGDVAVADADGYLWYQGRADDMFKAAGYRIGPSEIENCLVRHPAVANAAVVPSPDEVRGNVVKAFVVLAPGHAPHPRSKPICATRAQAPRAVRVPEGNRIHRRAADDDYRQGPAQGVARARACAQAWRRSGRRARAMTQFRQEASVQRHP